MEDRYSNDTGFGRKEEMVMSWTFMGKFIDDASLMTGRFRKLKKVKKETKCPLYFIFYHFILGCVYLCVCVNVCVCVCVHMQEDFSSDTETYFFN